MSVCHSHCLAVCHPYTICRSVTHTLTHTLSTALPLTCYLSFCTINRSVTHTTCRSVTQTHCSLSSRQANAPSPRYSLSTHRLTLLCIRCVNRNFGLTENRLSQVRNFGSKLVVVGCASPGSYAPSTGQHIPRKHVFDINGRSSRLPYGERYCTTTAQESIGRTSGGCEAAEEGRANNAPAPMSQSSARPTDDYLFKLLLIGDSGVGKTTLLTRYANGLFQLAFQPTTWATRS